MAKQLNILNNKRVIKFRYDSKLHNLRLSTEIRTLMGVSIKDSLLVSVMRYGNDIRVLLTSARDKLTDNNGEAENFAVLHEPVVLTTKYYITLPEKTRLTCNINSSICCFLVWVIKHNDHPTRLMLVPYQDQKSIHDTDVKEKKRFSLYPTTKNLADLQNTKKEPDDNIAIPTLSLREHEKPSIPKRACRKLKWFKDEQVIIIGLGYKYNNILEYVIVGSRADINTYLREKEINLYQHFDHPSRVLKTGQINLPSNIVLGIEMNKLETCSVIEEYQVVVISKNHEAPSE